MYSLAPCLQAEADTRMFARDTVAAKRSYKKISSDTVDTHVVVLVIPVVQQLAWMNFGAGKNGWLSLE